MNFGTFAPPKILYDPFSSSIIVLIIYLIRFYVRLFYFRMFIVSAEYVFLKISDSKKSQATFLAQFRSIFDLSSRSFFSEWTMLTLKCMALGNRFGQKLVFLCWRLKMNRVYEMFEQICFWATTHGMQFQVFLLVRFYYKVSKSCRMV